MQPRHGELTAFRAQLFAPSGDLPLCHLTAEPYHSGLSHKACVWKTLASRSLHTWRGPVRLGLATVALCHLAKNVPGLADEARNVEWDYWLAAVKANSPFRTPQAWLENPPRKPALNARSLTHAPGSQWWLCTPLVATDLCCHRFSFIWHLSPKSSGRVGGQGLHC